MQSKHLNIKDQPKPVERHSITTPNQMHDFVLDWNWQGADLIQGMTPWTCVKCGELRRLPQNEAPINSFGCSQKLLPTMNLVRQPLPTPEFYNTDISTGHRPPHGNKPLSPAAKLVVGILLVMAVCLFLYGIAAAAQTL